MNNDKKNKLIPDLRFPEFVGEGEWIGKTLGSCLSRDPEYGINAPAVPYSDKLPTYLRITDISEDGRFIKNSKVSVDQNVVENNFLCDGDIVLTRTGASVGKSYKYRTDDGRLVFAGFLIRIKPDESKLSSDFLSQFLFTSQYWKWVTFISARSGQPGINGTEFSSMPLSLPPTFDEQQKIASCLSSLDEVIAAHSQKLEALKEHKKGLMQNLFPQEGETVPKKRFPEFLGDGEWVEKRLGDLLEFKNGINASKEQYGKGIKFINVLDILQNEFICYEKIMGSVDISQQTLEKFSVAYGDILFQRSSETQGEVGSANVYLDKERIATFGGFVIRGKKIGKYDPVFLNKILKSEFVRESISSKSGGSTRFNIGQEALASIKIPLPNLEEQEKTADCLSLLDESITTQTQKIDQLKLHKKGLMQGLFPKQAEN